MPKEILAQNSSSGSKIRGRCRVPEAEGQSALSMGDASHMFNHSSQSLFPIPPCHGLPERAQFQTSKATQQGWLENSRGSSRRRYPRERRRRKRGGPKDRGRAGARGGAKQKAKRQKGGTPSFRRSKVRVGLVESLEDVPATARAATAPLPVDLKVNFDPEQSDHRRPLALDHASSRAHEPANLIRYRNVHDRPESAQRSPV